MPSPVQSIVMLTRPLQTGSTVLSGQWDTTGLRAFSSSPSNAWQQFFGRFAFLRQQETDLPPAELCTVARCVAIKKNGYARFEKRIIDWFLLIPENTQLCLAAEAIRPCGRFGRLPGVNKYRLRLGFSK
ncbi:hypothetical protein TNCV_473331 [Trichonephila clavipes]|nr:hypothetical protein TNCV_473331 [Trichonephila clavipes]